MGYLFAGIAAVGGLIVGSVVMIIVGLPVAAKLLEKSEEGEL